MIELSSYVAGKWIAPAGDIRPIPGAISAAPVARLGTQPPDTGAMLHHAQQVGGAALRAVGFHDRARMLKALAGYLDSRKEELYALSALTGATRKDGWIDIEGGIGTLFVFASKGRREMPDGQVYLDGGIEQLSKTGTFLGQHIAVPRRGVAVQINAFNFPVWGMLEKLAPAILAGMPVIVKPATATAYVAQAAFQMILESGALPDGAVQFIAGGTGALLDQMGAQDVVSFTGSAQTALALRSNPAILRTGARFISEQDSLNASLLGPDAAVDGPEFALFIKEVATEMTTKAGQKCTAIRRVFVPEARVAPVIEALSERLSKVTLGDPAARGVTMGALVSTAQRDDVLAATRMFAGEARLVHGKTRGFAVTGADADKGAFLPPLLYHCADPDTAQRAHDTEAFGPVSTIMPYRDLAHGAALLNRGGGSLVASVITNDTDVARVITHEAAAWHGRIYINNRTAMAEATGHGSPLPHMTHGGPGRAGGGEEMGGIRGVMHYMQRTAVQGSPDMLTAVTGQWVKGAAEISGPAHPFRRIFSEISIGETIRTAARVVTQEDISHFAEFTGDTFYAHMDDAAARANPFFPGRVAHGYLLLSFAAGLFVEPNPGPVLANTGLNALVFKKPVSPGDAVRVRLSAKRKTRRTQDYGELAWHVTMFNQNDEEVAEYELLTMVSYTR